MHFLFLATIAVFTTLLVVWKSAIVVTFATYLAASETRGLRSKRERQNAEYLKK